MFAVLKSPDSHHQTLAKLAEVYLVDLYQQLISIIKFKNGNKISIHIIYFF